VVTCADVSVATQVYHPLTLPSAPSLDQQELLQAVGPPPWGHCDGSPAFAVSLQGFTVAPGATAVEHSSWATTGKANIATAARAINTLRVFIILSFAFLLNSSAPNGRFCAARSQILANSLTFSETVVSLRRHVFQSPRRARFTFSLNTLEAREAEPDW
jgi:hypothetical protein